MNKYILVGAGGTGSHFIGPALAYLKSYHSHNNEEWEFHIVDGDSFESKNLNRQMFDPSFVGINKAEALASMFPQYPVIPVPKFIGAQDLTRLMEEEALVFIGADNFSIRALIEAQALMMKNVIIINAGNESHDGNVQLWVRRGGKNKTPRLSYCHPEIKYLNNEDRSTMTCAEVSQLPGGEQLIIANMAAAQHMLAALWRYHTGTWKTGWTELQFDLLQGNVDHIDMRQRKNWAASPRKSSRALVSTT